MDNRRSSNQLKFLPAWVTDSSDPEPVVISSRVRLARNLRGIPFPHLASADELLSIAYQVSSVMSERDDPLLKHYQPIFIEGLTDSEKAALVDSHLVSLAHVQAGPHRIALLDKTNTNSVLVNEEDHLRIQTVLPGLMPFEAWQEANRIDDALTRLLPIAFHATYGYLTSSLANAGTGMRVSVMLHLPALAFLNKLDSALAAAAALGGTIRGYYGEDGAAHGHVYQVSNSVALGNQERGIVGRLTSSATFLQTDELVGRHILRTIRRDDIQFLVSKSLEQLDHATALSAEEAMRILSNLRLGEMLGLPVRVSHKMFCEMITLMRGSIGSIASQKNRARDVFFEDTKRPALLRNKLRLELAASSTVRPPLALPE